MKKENCLEASIQGERVVGPLFFRDIKGDKGNVVDGHTHHFDHVTMVRKGSVHIKLTDPSGKVVEKDMFAPDEMNVPAECLHEITILEDGTEYSCVYTHRDEHGDVIQDASEQKAGHNNYI